MRANEGRGLNNGGGGGGGATTGYSVYNWHCFSLTEERHQGEVVAEEHRKWQRQVQEEGQQMREGRMKALARCEELQQRLRQAEEEREAVERKLNKEAGY